MRDQLVRDSSSYDNESKYTQIIGKLGRDGKYQRHLFFFLAFTSFYLNGIFCIMPLSSSIPEHKCESHDSPLKEEYYSTVCTNMCPELTVFLMKERTILVDFNMMCNAETFYDGLTSFSFFVKLILLVVLSYISDKIGRLVTIKVYFGYSVVLYIAILFIRDPLFLYVVCGILSGNLFHYVNVIVVSSEFFSQDLNSTFNAVVGTCFSIGGLVQVGVYYVFMDWRVNIAMCIVAHLVFFLMIFILDYEPYDYLLNVKQYADLNKTIEAVARYNDRVELVEDDLKEMNIMKNVEIPSTSLMDSIRQILSPYVAFYGDKKSFKILMGLFVPAYVVEFLYFGQVLNVEKIGGNTIVNLTLLFSSECTVQLIMVKYLHLWPRVKSIQIGMVACAVFCFMIQALHEGPLKMAFLFLNSFAATSNIVVISLYATELFPPKFKGVALSITLNLACISIIIQPVFTYLFDNIMLQFSLFALGSLWFTKDLKETLG